MKTSAKEVIAEVLKIAKMDRWAKEQIRDALNHDLAEASKRATSAPQKAKRDAEKAGGGSA